MEPLHLRIQADKHCGKHQERNTGNAPPAVGLSILQNQILHLAHGA